MSFDPDRAPSVTLYIPASIGMYLFGIVAICLGLYNRFTTRTLTLDVIAGVLLGLAVVCYFKKKEVDDWNKQMQGRYGSRR